MYKLNLNDLSLVSGGKHLEYVTDEWKNIRLIDAGLIGLGAIAATSFRSVEASIKVGAGFLCLLGFMYFNNNNIIESDTWYLKTYGSKYRSGTLSKLE